MSSSSRIKIPFRTAVVMVGDYAKSRILDQLKSVSFILLYLVGFQILVLGSTPAHALRVAGGISMVVLGLAFFLEGLILGLMPVGERVGVQLPRRCGILVIVVFGLLLGMGSTFAEPAMASLRAAGSTVTAWGSPLLFSMLNQNALALVAAVAIGVGVAVAFGMVRFFYGLSIKPFIFILIPLLLLISGYCAMDENLQSILGLAWDAGAVTTGAVTVPLVLALGIGVSRASGKQEDAAGGFGIIMLASAFPVLAVLTLGLILNTDMPSPASGAEFFNTEHLQQALSLFEDENAMHQHALRMAGEDARAWFPDQRMGELTSSITDSLRPISEIIRQESLLALRAVLPLTALLLAVLWMLRDRLRHMDEVVLGIGLAIVGMALLTTGIQTGLAPLGDQVGRPLPRVFSSVAKIEGRVILSPFSLDEVRTAFAPDGSSTQFFYFQDKHGTPQVESFDPQRFDASTASYEHILKSKPLFGPELTIAGIGLVFLFAFGLGYGSTLAEPALSALGRTVEEVSVGTIRSKNVVLAVSLGVGTGLMVGVARLLYDIPTFWLILPPYLILLPLTYFSEEDFAGIAWDCGGVTTGGITVPLVLAMGLGIGGELNVSDGFGLLAMASAYPIVTVLIFGLVVRSRQKKRIREADVEDEDE
ncbi:DUF1538 domain-containing protein [Kiritimatiellota bacterium B12222]|nr:DUF1538 domain-containing protein [Kiritimatiellota bacterium B12222]